MSLLNNTQNILTQHANDLLEFNYPDWINIFSVYEDVYHDGHDEYGPQSYLYDLYVYYEHNGKKVIDIWHWENWFSPNIPVGYIEANEVEQYSYQNFLSHSHFSRFATHLRIQESASMQP